MKEQIAKAKEEARPDRIKINKRLPPNKEQTDSMLHQ